MIILGHLLLVAPLFLPALSLSCGIILYWFLPKFWLLQSIIMSIISFLIIRFKKQYIYITFLILFPYLLGLVITHKQQKDYLVLHNMFTEMPISIRGTVYDIERTEHEKFPYTITINVNGYKTDNMWHNVTSRIKIMTQKYRTMMVGDYVEIYNISSSPAQHDFLYYLMKENIGAYFFIPHIRFKKLQRPIFSLARFLYKKRKQLALHLKQYCSKETPLYFNMLFLGKKEKNDALLQTNNQFKHWGISHMTARSGMHMTIFTLLCNGFMNFVPLSFMFKQICIGIITILYALFSYPAVSFMRAFFTILCIIYCHCIYRRSNFLHVTLFVYIIQLITNPLLIFFLDFQLSFLLTIGIGFFSKKYFYKTLI